MCSPEGVLTVRAEIICLKKAIIATCVTSYTLIYNIITVVQDSNLDEANKLKILTFVPHVTRKLKVFVDHCMENEYFDKQIHFIFYVHVNISQKL